MVTESHQGIGRWSRANLLVKLGNHDGRLLDLTKNSEFKFDSGVYTNMIKKECIRGPMGLKWPEHITTKKKNKPTELLRQFEGCTLCAMQFMRVSVFIYAYELMLCLVVFNQTGPQQLVNWSAPPPICYIKMEESRLVPCPTSYRANLPASLRTISFLLRTK